jgi:hypothetical protein
MNDEQSAVFDGMNYPAPGVRRGPRIRRRAGAWVVGACALALADIAVAEAERNLEDQLADARAAPVTAGRRGNFLFVPIPVSNPTVGSGLQAAVLYLHPTPAGQPQAPGATSGLGVMATDSGSRAAGLFHDASYANDRWRIGAFAGAAEFELRFFGIGDGGALGGKPVPYQVRGGVGQVRVERRLPDTNHWFAGFTYLFVQSQVRFSAAGPTPGLPELSGQFQLGALGPQVTYDSRDDNYFPHRGSYARLRWSDYSSAWGSDFAYTKFDFFYNYYQPVTANGVLALRTRVQSASEDTPFLDLPTLDMRGFSRDRYRDQRTVSVTAEGRYKFRPRWGMVAFAEAGRFAKSFDELSNSRTITTWGAGLRWQVTADRAMHLGLDAAVSTDDSAVFIQVGERF